MGKQNKIISKNKVINVVLICDNYGLAINIQNILLLTINILSNALTSIHFKRLKVNIKVRKKMKNNTI